MAEFSTALAVTQQVSYLTQDHLGSPRVITDQNGAVTNRKDYTAFVAEDEIMKLLLILLVAGSVFAITGFGLNDKPEHTADSIKHKAVGYFGAGLNVYVELNKKELRLDEKTKMTVSLKNNGDLPLYVYKDLAWGPSSSLTCRILTEDDQEITSSLLSDAKDFPPFRTEDFYELFSDRTLSKERWLDVRTAGIRKPGRYKLIVDYHSPVPLDSAPKDLRIWSKEDGIVSSNTTIFEIE